MATISIESSTTVTLRGGSSISYLSARNLTSANKMYLNATSVQPGQYKKIYSPIWNVMRDGLIFDLSGLPEGAEVTAATLKIYVNSDSSDTDFTVSVSEAHLSSPPTYSDYSTFDGPLGSFGTLATSGIAVGSFNNIVFNSTGLTYLNAAIQVGEVELGIRSWNDLVLVAPTQDEFITLSGQAQANRPVLDLTYTELSSGEYPDAPVFAATGKIDLVTYSIISNYLTGLDADISSIADTDGNITLDEDNWITWDTTSEKIAYDSVNDRVTITSLDSGGLNVVGNLILDSMTISGDSSADNCTVTGILDATDTGYASIQSQVDDDEERVYSRVGAASPADDTLTLYMDFTEGDFRINTRDDGQAGTKTAILADFSGL